ncbi:MAG: dihydrolipoyl dehydrogenase [Synergistaceae bacterium]|jgi:dihydrolipoamide dehydrogenase|nr:dihydrolipoyl dehydrogenase [Synergistaceae bacterium]
MYDLLIIGGGPAGYSAAIAASRMKKKVVLFESDRIGGTCLNVGCIPTKYLLHKGALLGKIRNLTMSGVFRDAGQFSFSRIAAGKRAAVNRLVEGLDVLLRKCNAQVIYGWAELTGPQTVRCEGNEYAGKNILIATGSEPVIPQIPGSLLAVDSTKLLNVEKVPESIAVIGGGVIGLELAAAFRTFGSKVTVLEAMPEILPNEETETVKMLAANLIRSGIEMKLGVKVSRIDDTGAGKKVSFDYSGNADHVQAETVLMAAGRKTKLTGIDAEKLGLALDERGNIATDEHMRTNLPNVYASGDAAGGWQLAHVAYAEAECAVSNMFEKKRRLDLASIPRCVYTIPSLASVGMTKAQAEERGVEFDIGRFPYAASGMAVAEETTEGSAVVLSERKTGRILGVHIFGECAHELIANAVTAITSGMNAGQWGRLTVPHPSLSEILPEAALNTSGRARHIL